MIYLTSDPHYYHRNVIRYCKRPFQTQEEMHDELIARWHRKVQDGDTVYILGDFAFCGGKRGAEIVARLRGGKKITIILIRGNHDANAVLKMGFDRIETEETLYWAGRKFTLSHFPYAPTAWEQRIYKLKNFWKFWRRKKYNDLRYMDRRPIDDGRWLLHGHVHNSWKLKRRMINVGVDVWRFTPVSMPEIAGLIRASES